MHTCRGSYSYTVSFDLAYLSQMELQNKISQSKLTFKSFLYLVYKEDLKNRNDLWKDCLVLASIAKKGANVNRLGP